MEINKRLGNLTPAVSKTPEPIVTKFGMGDEVGDTYLICKILLRSDKGFLLPAPPRFRARRREVSDSASFLVLPTAYSQDLVPGAAATKPPPPVIFCQVGVSHISVTESTPPVIFIPTRVSHICSGGGDFGKLQ